MTPLIAISLIVSFSIITIAACVWLGYKAGTGDIAERLGWLELELKRAQKMADDVVSDRNYWATQCFQLRCHVVRAHAQLRDRVKPKLP